MKQRVVDVAVRWCRIVFGVLGTILLIAIVGSAGRPEMTMATTDEPRGWLVIEGGSSQYIQWSRRSFES